MRATLAGELFGDRGGKAGDAGTDFFHSHLPEAEPHVVVGHSAGDGVGVEVVGAGDVEDAVLDAAVEEGGFAGGVDGWGEGEPDVEAAVRVGPVEVVGLGEVF